jgi:tubulin alpha
MLKGIQMGDACWELYCEEHGLNFADGSIDNHGSKQQQSLLHGMLNTVFDENSKGVFTPRSIMIDLEPNVIDQLKTGKSKHLYEYDNMICAKEGTGNNFASAYYSIGKRYIGQCMDKIAKLAEHCDSLQGFIITHSVAGGAGSGLSSLLFERLSFQYPKAKKASFSSYPASYMPISAIEPYNSMLCTHELLEYVDVGFMMDNQAVWNICREKFRIEQPNYFHMNRLISSAISSISLPIRFQGPLNNNLSEFQSNLIPYPRIHFISTSLSPIIQIKDNFTVDELTLAAFCPDYLFANYNPCHGRYMACNLLYQYGVHPRLVNDTILKYIKFNPHIRFVDWSPLGIKIGINNVSPVLSKRYNLSFNVQNSICMLSNNTAISSIFSRIRKKSDLMYKKRAFVHWYTEEGMEEKELLEARDNIVSLESDYRELSKDCYYFNKNDLL